MKDMIVKDLTPTALWGHFADLNAVPRPSKKEERVRAFMLKFGEQLQLEVKEDAVGNIVIVKPATKGMEARQSVVLQSHLDMVHQKNNDTVFDFDQQGIEMYVEDGYVKAKGTTLGADNGIGVAAIMAVLSSNDMPHPRIEALFTIDEETGMTGAKELDQNILSSNLLLNLDTEEDDELDVGCAGGVDVSGSKTFVTTTKPDDFASFSLTVKGLHGGHSGMDIDKGYGNANKLMTRILMQINPESGLRLSYIKGGNLRNAIPREATATFAVGREYADMVRDIMESHSMLMKEEFKLKEPHLHIAVAEVDEVTDYTYYLNAGDSQLLIKVLQAIPNGVYKMSPAIEGLVECSNNLSSVLLAQGVFTVECLTRSSLESSKHDLTNVLLSVFQLAQMNTDVSGDYPGWQPNMDSVALHIAKAKYEALFGESPRVVACHAGLECGLLGERYPDMDMVSFGPNIRGAHSPDERVEIASVQKFWTFLQAILADIPE